MQTEGPAKPSVCGKNATVSGEKSDLLLAKLADIGQRLHPVVERVGHSFIYTIDTEEVQQAADGKGGADGIAEDAENEEHKTLARMVAGEGVVLAEEARPDPEDAQVTQRGEDPVAALDIAGGAGRPVGIGTRAALLFRLPAGALLRLSTETFLFLPLAALLFLKAALALLFGPLAVVLLPAAALLLIFQAEILVLLFTGGSSPILIRLRGLIIAAGQAGAQAVRNIRTAFFAVCHRSSPAVSCFIG